MGFSIRNRCTALLAGSLLCASTLHAAEPAGISGPELAAILQDEGYRAELGVDGEGDPRITTRMSGVTVYVTTYDCVEDRCGSLQFGLGLDLDAGGSAAMANAFNSRYRYARVYLDEEGDPILAFDFDLPAQDQAAFIAAQVELWEDVLGSFLRDSGWLEDGQPGVAPVRG